MAETLILTVDNGGTNTRVSRGRRQSEGRRIGPIEAYPTPHEYEKAIRRIAATAGVVLDGKRPDVVGASVAANIQGGIIASAGKLQAYGWVDRSFEKDLADELGISPDRIVALNDCKAGANAERVARQPEDGIVNMFATLSTGFGGALYKRDEIIPDEPGHYHLKPGAVCGDGQEGHIEAHIGGSGIERKFGERGERIPHDDPRWTEIKEDFHDSMRLTLARYGEDLGVTLDTIGFTGSVALGGPDMLGGLQRNLRTHMGGAAPRIEQALYGEESGLYGAAFAAGDLLCAA